MRNASMATQEDSISQDREPPAIQLSREYRQLQAFEEKRPRMILRFQAVLHRVDDRAVQVLFLTLLSGFLQQSSFFLNHYHFCAALALGL